MAKIDLNGWIRIGNRYEFDNLDKWMCTDPDNGQFCYKHNSFYFTYIQVKPDSRFYEIALEDGCDFLRNHHNELTVNDLYLACINTRYYTKEEIREYVQPFGNILLGTKGAARKQLIAECIFETDWVENVM